jgi:hypothetical protein
MFRPGDFVMKRNLAWIITGFFWLTLSTAGAKEISTGIYSIKSQLLPNILAKELCSCVFVSGAGQRLGKRRALNRCIERANLPISETLLKQLFIIHAESDRIRVIPTVLAEVSSSGAVKPVHAIWNVKHPQYGCRLITRP